MDTQTLTPYEQGAQGGANATNPFPKDSNEAKWWEDGKKFAELHKQHPENYLPKDEPSVVDGKVVEPELFDTTEEVDSDE